MELKKDYRRVLTLEFMADDAIGYNEISPLLSAVRKIHEDSSTIGFQRRFSKDEQIILNGIWDKIKNDAELTIQKDDQGSVQKL